MKASTDNLVVPGIVVLSIATKLPAFAIGALAPLIGQELTLGAGRTGLLVASFAGAAGVTGPAGGWVASRWGCLRPMAVATLASAVITLGVQGWTVSWTRLALLLALFGVVSGVTQPAVNLALATHVGHGRRALVFGIKQAAPVVSTMVSGALVLLVAQAHGWRSSFVLFPFLAAIGLCLTVLARPPRPGRSRRPVERPGSLVVLALGLGCGTAAATGLSTFLVPFGLGEGLDLQTAGIMLSLGSALGVVIRIVAGLMVDRFEADAFRVSVVMVLGGAFGYAMLAVAVDGAVIAIGVLLAFGLGWGWPGLVFYATAERDRGNAAKSTGLIGAGGAAGQVAGPMLFGLLSESLSYRAAWAACVVLCLGSAWLMRRAGVRIGLTPTPI